MCGLLSAQSETQGPGARLHRSYSVCSSHTTTLSPGTLGKAYNSLGL